VPPYAIGGKMGEIVEMDSKGRIVIPSSIRNRFGLGEGALLLIEIRGDEIVLSGIAVEAEQAKPGADSFKDFLTES
jgi:AbrB family looped-hinge helix DNA binding protein